MKISRTWLYPLSFAHLYLFSGGVDVSLETEWELTEVDKYTFYYKYYNAHIYSTYEISVSGLTVAGSGAEYSNQVTASELCNHFVSVDHFSCFWMYFLEEALGFLAKIRFESCLTFDKNKPLTLANV